MISFQVNDMTCGHCVGAITQTLKATDATANVRFDLAAHRVDIEPSKADAAELREAIQQAGYTPNRIDAAKGAGDPGAAAARKGCCCS
ncbi:MAG: heavy-metal-associated domain-containing protein [Burkholderiaceae bacterium]